MRPLAAAAGVLLVAISVLAQIPEKPNAHVVELLEAIKGQEDKPSGEVFKNVQVLKGVPAARLLRIMDIGYSRSLGVGCDHCHVEDRWDSDEKRPKKAAREMMALVRQINESLGKMENVETPEATVNCTTCHRGYVKPSMGIK